MDYANKMINCFVLQCLKFSCYQINRIPDWWCIIINLQSCGLIWFTWRSFPHSATFSISRFIGVSDWGGVIGGCTYPQLNVMKGKTEEKKRKEKGETVISCKYLFDFFMLNTFKHQLQNFHTQPPCCPQPPRPFNNFRIRASRLFSLVFILDCPTRITI